MRLLIFFALLGLSATLEAEDVSAMDPTDHAIKALKEGLTYLDPSNMLAWVELPRSAKKGDRISLKLSLQNARQSNNFNLASVDLDVSFLDGFRVVSIAPSPEAMEDSLGMLTMEYPITIGPGETVDFVLELVAIKAGVYVGEVSFWDGEEFLSRYVQCKIVE